MHCAYFERGTCRSCRWLGDTYADQLQRKQASCQSALTGLGGVWLPIVPSAETAFRNKAKMVVSGHASSPCLGILDADGDGVDLANCPLYPNTITEAFEPLKRMIRRLGIPPYDVKKRQGELKYLLITVSEDDGSLMVRLVLRSDIWIGRLRTDLSTLMADLPRLAVLSVNIQPVHQAILEGEQEVILTDRETLTVHLNGLPLHLRPKSFFQTNTRVAERLYATARGWVAEVAPLHMWDLFCGVGGFALHCSDVVSGHVTGIEISAEAIASAQQSASELGLQNVSFHALGANEFIDQAVSLPQIPALVVVNPPRRGLGTSLCAFLDQSDVQTVIYSSCNPESLAQDLMRMPGFELVRAQILDLFPHTAHSEVLAMLMRVR
ncbi:MAG: 23S rRNA (uracil(747)-C(5))-methyltransferase [Halothiobacillus sp. 14-56-357]|jgi:23S rRNA (uracil747-C5)-methyltransferase|nr:MAG: 23S rRNA (uracil(747)-C(5))-methyltransferase [Halothiobacillus sp. 14-56-357]OZB79142.1 MAG: 23S rRNA (uracil(747)-C(5))-methyltransferase [Halothiobacillus sp. 13-55-115]